jgi:hypothetical protein
LALRRRYLAPHLSNSIRAARFEIVDEVLRVEWRLADGQPWRLFVHFGEHAAYAALPTGGTTVFSMGSVPAATPQARLEPGAVIAVYG